MIADRKNVQQLWQLCPILENWILSLLLPRVSVMLASHLNQNYHRRPLCDLPFLGVQSEVPADHSQLQLMSVEAMLEKEQSKSHRGGDSDFKLLIFPSYCFL